MKKNLGFFETIKLKRTAIKDVANYAFEDYLTGKKYPAVNVKSASKDDVVISAFMVNEINDFAYTRDRYFKEHHCVYKNRTANNKVRFKRKRFDKALAQLESDINCYINSIELLKQELENKTDAIEKKYKNHFGSATPSEINALCEKKKAVCKEEYTTKINSKKNVAVSLLDEKIRLINKVDYELQVRYRRHLLRINTYYKWANKAMPELPAVCANGEKLLQVGDITILGKHSDIVKDSKKRQEDILKM